MHFPISNVVINPWLLILIGFVVGVCGGFFGVGGAFIVTPALNILGFPMAYAIGTDMAHIMGKSMIGSIRHRKQGNVDIRAAAVLVLGTVPGVELGARFVLWLEGKSLVEPVIRLIYIFILLLVGSFMLWEYLRARHFSKEDDYLQRNMSNRIQKVKLKPTLSLPTSRIPSISFWILLGVGFFTGFLAGLLGVGGGFIRVPALLYLVGMPTAVAVGTDLMEIFFSGAYGAFTYALKGRVDIFAALFMLLGAGVGTHIGVIATDYVKGVYIKACLAATMLITATSIFLKTIGAGKAATYLLIVSASLISLQIIVKMLWEMKKDRDEKIAGTLGEGAGRRIGT